jgi:hypothetical protein
MFIKNPNVPSEQDKYLHEKALQTLFKYSRGIIEFQNFTIAPII